MTIQQINKEQGELVFDLFDKYRIFYNQHSNIELAKTFIQARLDNNESVIFVAFEDNSSTAIGFTQLYPKYSSVRLVQNWILNDLYVEKEHRKKGVGEALIKAAMNFARERNSKFVELSTAIDNFVAQSLYEQIGFKKLAPETDFYSYRIDVI